MNLKLELPTQPGVYRFYDEAGTLIYVGKAKNLRRRISQYRNAKRCKAHTKMRRIKKEAHRFEFELCESEYEALKRENEWIQTHRPKWNVVGAFSFLYPMIGIRLGTGTDEGNVYVCYTTEPQNHEGVFDFHGAYRSRLRTRAGFFSLIELMRLIGHPISHPNLVKMKISGPKKKYEYIYGFRMIPTEWSRRLDAFLGGDDFRAIEDLSMLLLEKPSALARSKEIQDHLREIRSFWRHEIQALRRAREFSRYERYPVPQKERDGLFLNFKNPEMRKKENAELQR